MELSGRGKDWSGKRVGNVTVQECVGKDRHHVYVWRCLCDCGSECTKTSAVLQRGVDYCSHACPLKQGNVTHGMSYTHEYRAWIAMKSRCFTRSNKNYAAYGGRGVTVHPDWVDDFQKFFSHIGVAPSSEHTVDRIDNNGNYEPGNVRWATQAEQCLNRNNTLKATIDGVEMPLVTVADKYGVLYATVRERYKRGLRGADLITNHKVGRKPGRKDSSC